jgi:hypothetical protein
MTEHPVDRPAPGPQLPAEVRERLLDLLATSLGAAWDAAIDAGADPVRLTEIVDQLRRTMRVRPTGEGARG